MSVSSEIKDFLASEVVRGACCEDAFGAGKRGEGFAGRCEGCRASYTAGVFAGAGTATDPSKGFHLEMKVAPETAERLLPILQAEGLAPKTCPAQKGKIRLYYKDSAAISDFLAYIGASKYALAVMEAEVIRSVRGKETRKINAELANIDRAATAAAEQLRAIEKLKAHGALGSLPAELAETAELRLKHPYMPLGELRRQFSPQLSKPGLSHRLKRLLAEADRLDKGL